MKKEDIIKELEKQKGTVLDFPNRGKDWGNKAYRGNCSGFVPAYFIHKYEAKSVAEIFAGSGTTSDVCKDFEIPYIGIDLNPNPMREDIISMDILDYSRDLPNGFYTADMVFLHPPYPSINDVHYVNAMWKGDKELAKKDIQEMSWEQGMNAVNKAIMRGYAAMHPGAYEVVLVGEIRSKGQYRSMYQNLAIPGILHQTFIKMQHNTVSGNRRYGKSDFALTEHEMIAVIKKPSGYEIAFVMPKRYEVDIRDSRTSTWKDVVTAVLRNLRGNCTLNQIYREIESHEKAKANPHWKEKVRQILQQLQYAGVTVNTSRGMWSMAA